MQPVASTPSGVPRRACAGAVLGLALFLPHVAPAQTYDAVSDFSTASNPNGVWSYGTLSNVNGGTFTLYNNGGENPEWTGPANFWDNSGTPPDRAAIVHNESSTNTIDATEYPYIYIPPDVLDLDGEDLISVLRWTAPTSGTYDVSGFFERIDAQAQPVDIRVLQNGATVLLSVNNFTGNANEQPFSFASLNLPAGATLDFVESGQQATDDHTGISVTVTRTSTSPFFSGQTDLGNDNYYLQLPSGVVFGYYAYLSDPHYLFHYDLGYEYVFENTDADGGVYFYDFASQDFFYTSSSYPFPYLYDFGLNAVLYYYPESGAQPPQTYTSNPRYFFDFATGQIITR